MKKVGILVFVGVLSLGSNAFAQTGDSKNTKPTIVFVHGLWPDGSCWGRVINRRWIREYKEIPDRIPTRSLEAVWRRPKGGFAGPAAAGSLVGNFWVGPSSPEPAQIRVSRPWFI